MTPQQKLEQYLGALVLRILSLEIECERLTILVPAPKVEST